MAAITRTQYQALVEPFGWAADASSFWSAESTYDEAGVVAGQPVAAQASALVLRATGSQTGTVQVRVQTGGHAGPGLGDCSLVQRPGTSGAYYGWEGPATVWTGDGNGSPDFADLRSELADVMADLEAATRTVQGIGIAAQITVTLARFTLRQAFTQSGALVSCEFDVEVTATK